MQFNYELGRYLFVGGYMLAPDEIDEADKLTAQGYHYRSRMEALERVTCDAEIFTRLIEANPDKVAEQNIDWFVDQCAMALVYNYFADDLTFAGLRRAITTMLHRWDPLSAKFIIPLTGCCEACNARARHDSPSL